jgi:hypothetical protein
MAAIGRFLPFVTVRYFAHCRPGLNGRVRLRAHIRYRNRSMPSYCESRSKINLRYSVRRCQRRPWQFQLAAPVYENWGDCPSVFMHCACKHRSCLQSERLLHRARQHFHGFVPTRCSAAHEHNVIIRNCWHSFKNLHVCGDLATVD